MQSQESSKAEGRHPLPLPWGFGSMAWHGKNWWLIYRDAENKVHYENAGSPDAAEAQKVLAEKALPRARAILAALERIAAGETYDDGGTGPRARKRRVDRGVKRPKALDGKEAHSDGAAGAGSSKPRKVGGDRGGTAKTPRRSPRKETTPGGKA